MSDDPFVRTGRTGVCKTGDHGRCTGDIRPGCGCRCHFDEAMPAVGPERITEVDG